MFNLILDSFATIEQGQRTSFLIGSGFAAVGAVCAWFLLPDMNKALETEAARF